MLPVLRLLPDVLFLRTQAEDEDWLHRTSRFSEHEATQRVTGNESVITPLSNVLIIQAIRSWIESERVEKQGWMTALLDKKVAKVMSLMHRHPEYDWRVTSLASDCGKKRSGFSARFTQMVGESVLCYLPRLRTQLAYRELCQSDAGLAQIAERVGYHCEPDFKRAFIQRGL